VDAAVRNAQQHGELLIHAPGNHGATLVVEGNHPPRDNAGGGQAANWIEVAASSWSVDSLAATFSNHGQTKVDLFAPGVDILSTVPGGDFKQQDGTSMASPVVSGVAALLMAYFPNLTAADVKRILMESSVKYADRLVPPPGPPGAPVRFGTLSVTGGVVNAYAAVRMALGVM
jgi:subtilisin family serine protease